jgi:opine dehydrogenase
MSTVTVIGSGAVGMAVASELALAGNNVNLYELPRFKENIEPVMQAGGINLIREGKTNFAKLGKITTDMAEAVKSVPVILIATVSLAHQEIAELAAPHVEKGQQVIIFAGQMGSIEFKNVLNKKRPGLDIALAETITAPYSTRREAPGKPEVTIRSNMKNLALGVMPTRYTTDVMKTIEQFYPKWFFPASNVVEVGLNSLNTLAHPAPVLFMISQIERGDNYIYRAFTPSIFKVVKASWDEKVAILNKLGLKDLYPYEDFVKLVSIPGNQQLTGPSNIQHRFIIEDCPMGVVALTSFGDLVGVPTPVCKAVVSLYSVIVGRDFFKEGRNLKRLGLEGMSLAQLKKFLVEGK